MMASSAGRSADSPSFFTFLRVYWLWWLGGLGCVVLLAMTLAHRQLVVVPVWVAAGCLTIAINGSRGLPQYFLQVGSPLALAAGLFLAAAWHRFAGWGRGLLVAMVAIGVWHVRTIPKTVDCALFDLPRVTDRLDRQTYLSRFGESRSDQKYSALAIDRLADHLRTHTTTADRVGEGNFLIWHQEGA